LVWCEDGWNKRNWEWYIQNEEKTWWLLSDGSGNGFKKETIEAHKHAFFLFNTEEGAKEFIRVKQWEDKHCKEPALGDEDFCCPSCSRRFIGKDVFEYDEVNTTPYKITCLCGEEILVEPWVEIGYTVKTVD